MKIAVEAKPTPAGEDGNICYEDGETNRYPNCRSNHASSSPRRRVDLCRQADFIKRALCLLNMVSPGDNPKFFAIAFRATTETRYNIYIYSFTLVLIVIATF